MTVRPGATQVLAYLSDPMQLAQCGLEAGFLPKRKARFLQQDWQPSFRRLQEQSKNTPQQKVQALPESDQAATNSKLAALEMKRRFT